MVCDCWINLVNKHFSLVAMSPKPGPNSQSLRVDKNS